ncbi:ABC transporter substrate-binding protein [Parvicella tangerina]|uniref:Dipeptide-binding protein DppE n=1 Tax=Parvicella tangerina TaxID=2829795 RepID=A0A916JL34_9FLAO|nr:ABC transporter substrate-binding protein [Parvicella tangerina]CAG5080356.1 Dipeptide-binding protein DppE [Parvicella tangerina]
MKKLSLGVAVLILLFFAGCGSKTDEVENNGMLFRYNEPAGLKTLDPAKVVRFEDFIAVGNLFNGLVTLDKDMVVQPDLADYWTVSQDGTEYTFYLRKGVVFHDSKYFKEGTRVLDAYDVVYSYLRIMDPEFGSPGKYVFANVDRGKKSNYKGIVAVDDFTVKIFLKRPQPSFLYQLSLPYGFIVPHEVVDAEGEMFGLNPVGTGPFKLVKWKRDVKLVLGKHENYFEVDDQGNPLPYLDAVSVSFIGDKHSELVQFKNGNFEMISGLNEGEKDDILDLNGELVPDLQEEHYLIKTPWLYTEYLGILVDSDIDLGENQILMNRKVRQAIGYAIDRKGLIKYIRNGVGVPASTGFVPEGMPDYASYAIDGFEYDLDKAKKLLLESGYADVNNKPKITLRATVDYKGMCEYLQKQLDDLGLDVQIDIIEGSYMNTTIAQFETNFYRKSWIADFPDAINYFQLFYSKNFYPENGLNYTHFSDPTYDEFYEKALVEDSVELRYSYYKQMHQILHEQAPVIPIYYGETLRFYNKSVSGVESNALNMLDLTRVKVK